MPPIRSGRPSREASFSRGLSPQPAPITASRQMARAALMWRRRSIGARSLSLDDPRALAETRGLHRLEAGDRGACERLPGRLLEDQPQPLERRLRLAVHPAVEAEPLLERLTRGAGFEPGGHLDARVAVAGACQLPGHATLGTEVAAAVCSLDDPARRLRLHDRHLEVQAREGRLELVARSGAHALRARVGQPVVVLEVIAPRRTQREVRDVLV